MKSKVQKQELKVHARIEFIAEEYSGGSMELVKETYREYTVKPGAGMSFIYSLQNILKPATHYQSLLSSMPDVGDGCAHHLSLIHI